MKRLTLPLLFVALLTEICAIAQPAAGRTVYILPMAGGLDQYLAQQITHDRVMQVVTDPRAADALMTDRLGEGFEQALAKSHPHKDDPNDSENPHHSFRSTGPKGTIFLVDAKSRQVIWSDFEKPPRDLSVSSLSRAAERIVKRLQGVPGKPGYSALETKTLP